MRRHFLVTISNDLNALYGLKFLGRFVSDPSSVDVTLFLSAMRPAKYDPGLPSFEEKNELELQTRKREAQGFRTLEQARKFLVAYYGFNPDHINLKFKFRDRPTNIDIILEGEHGLYDAIILGRRGLSRVQEIVEDSVTSQIFIANHTIPLWICRPTPPDNQDILLCVDGSDPSLRIADHVGFILAAEPRHKAHIFHVWDPAKEETRMQAEDIVDQARAVLEENNVPDQQISWEIVKSSGAARVILERVRRGSYAAVAVGRTGEEAPFLHRLVIGSVSLKLLRSIETGSLWVSN